LFFVALGFGVVFTNLWIIVGVKYCFRYNARNRQIRAGEDAENINLDNMPARPHRRRREKKLMTMDEVNERFPLTKYKNWVASRAREGLSTSGGVSAPSRPESIKNVDGIEPSSPVVTTSSTDDKSPAAVSQHDEIIISPATNHLGGDFGHERKSMEAPVAEKATSDNPEEAHSLEQVNTTASTVDKHPTATSEEEDDEDDHIHTAVPPELLTNPGDTCAICIDTLEENDDIRGLSCGHAFHAGCLDPWLTSRRACCPLCKADYYTPKPRAEGDVADAERGARRVSSGRPNVPQPPPSAWTGFRGGSRLVLGGRYLTPPADRYGYDRAAFRRDQRRGRREAADASAQANAAAPDAGAAENNAMAAPQRWRPRIPNPFNTSWRPAIRLPVRTRHAEIPAAENGAAERSPSQLEAGVIL